MAHLLDKESQDIPRIMLCGPKGAGKSTFARLLANSFLTRKFARNGVGFLDLDPGQPEYSPPGDLSLVHMKNCNLGPPFTHPHIPDGSEDSMIRSHHIGSNSPQNDKIHYQRCAADLLTRYDQHLRPLGAPLIINSCGWIQGVGLEILEELIQAYKLTDVIYMSTTGPEEVIETLQEATTRAGVSFHTLSSQPTDIITRSPADLRLMQTLSYFHLDEPEDGTLRWDPTPLYIWPFERLPYSGTDQTFIGTMFLGEEINLEGYGTIVNGTILSLVLVEDESALPPDVRPSIVGIRPQDGDNVLPGHSNAWAQSGTANDSNGDSEEEDLGPGKPSIRRTKDGFPYFFVGKGANEPLDPSKTRSLGQVYVRSLGIDEKAHRIYSPISWEKIQSYTSKGAALVLVRGNLEVPSWSYLEEYHEAIAAKRDRTRWKKYKEAFDLVDGNGIESDGSVEFDVREWADETPWVVVPEPTGKGERKRDKVWRTRRNLQTNDGRRKA